MGLEPETEFPFPSMTIGKVASFIIIMIVETLRKTSSTIKLILTNNSLLLRVIHKKACIKF